MALTSSPELQLRGRSIFVYMANQLANFVSPFARRLQQRHGIQTILVCTRTSELPNPRLYDFDPQAFAGIVEFGNQLEPCPPDEVRSGSALAQAAADTERDLGVNLIDIIRVDRHVGLGFVAGGLFMRSRFGGGGIDYPGALELCIRLCRFSENVLNEHQPFALVSGHGAVFSSALSSVAEARGIAIRWPVFARTGKQYFWAENRHNWPSGLVQAYTRSLDEIEADGPQLSRLEMPYAASKGLVSNRTNVSLSALFGKLRKVIRNELSDRRRGRTFRYGSYLFRDRLWLIFERWRWRRRVRFEPHVAPSLPDGLPYVFYPLHMEPEVAIMSEAQAADTQLAFIEWLAKTVPGGWYVIVKEHPNATTPRPPGFTKRLNDLPNVIVAAPLENGEAIAYDARAVAVINGTVGIQAAIAGVPVVTFHEHYQARLMPHVFYADSYGATREILTKIAGSDLPPLAERAHAGRAFLRALEDCAFPISNPGLLTGRSGDVKLTQEEVRTFVDRFLATFVEHRANAEPAG